jgi:glycosyltransferase involved in cell wall biosynthesis
VNRIPEISVCIPAFNHQKYIGACIDSVLNQTLAPSEVIITDDCSTDGTVDVVKAYADPRIRLFRNKVNSGPSVAANNNMRRARGEYLCLLASDDMFHPTKLARQADYLQRHPGVGLVFSLQRTVGEDGAPLENSVHDTVLVETDRPREAWLAKFFHGINELSAPTVMMRRQVVERVGYFDARLLQTQDFDYWIKAAVHFDIHVLPEPLVDYRERANQGNASAGSPDKQARTAWEMAKVLRRFREIDDEDLFFRIFPQARAWYGRGLPLAALLAVQAVQAEESFTRNFGLDLLYELLGEPAMAEKLEAIGFGYPGLFKFAALAADRWALDEAANWRAANANLEAALAERNAAYDWQVGQVESWKATCAAQARELEELRAAFAARASRGLRRLLRRFRPGPAGGS